MAPAALAQQTPKGLHPLDGENVLIVLFILDVNFIRCILSPFSYATHTRLWLATPR